MRILLAVALPGVLAAQEDSAARIRFFEAQPRLVKPGEAVVLTWQATGSDRVRLDPPGEEHPASGQATRTVQGPTVFWLSVSNAKGGQSVPLMVEVLAPPPPVALPPSPTQGPAPWIQFAALADREGAERLAALLQERVGEPARLTPVAHPDHPDRVLHRVRLGPFASRAKAQQRLREVLARTRDLKLKPLIMVD